MINPLEDVLERKELGEVLKLEQQVLKQTATIDKWLGSALSALWRSFNASTAKHARRYQIRAYLFG